MKFPAVNFFDCTKRKLNIDFSYFDENDYYLFKNGKRMYKNSFLEFSIDDLMNSFDKHSNDIYIIHGDMDKTVLLSDVICFCDKYDVNFDIVNGAGHGMPNHLGVVNDLMIKYLKK